MFPIGRRVDLSHEELAYVLAAIDLQKKQAVATDEDRRKLELIVDKLKSGKLVGFDGVVFAKGSLKQFNRKSQDN